MILVTKTSSVCVCVCVCVFLQLHMITAQSGPVILVILCHSPLSSQEMCVCRAIYLFSYTKPRNRSLSSKLLYATRIGPHKVGSSMLD